MNACECCVSESSYDLSDLFKRGIARLILMSWKPIRLRIEMRSVSCVKTTKNYELSFLNCKEYRFAVLVLMFKLFRLLILMRRARNSDMSKESWSGCVKHTTN